MEPVIPGVEETDNEITFDTGKIRLVLMKDPIGFELCMTRKEPCFTVICTEIPFRWTPTAA
ncbi:MAG: hypothetical protein ACLR0U_28180 [Enterocloster clostridioformis]